MFKGYAKPPSTSLYVPVCLCLYGAPDVLTADASPLFRPCLSVCMPYASRCPTMEKAMHAYLP